MTPTQPLRRGLAIALIVALGIIAVLGALLVRQRWQREAEAEPMIRGRVVAEKMGCFACHGPGGVRPIPNPGAQVGEVPDWSGGTWMMWNRDPADIRAWILDGAAPNNRPDANALIPMPAYRGRMNEEDLDALVAYVLAVAQFGFPEDEAVIAGREVATQWGCFGCHGPEGRGILWNPGSFKGFIPGWDGDDFEELVATRDEFDEWVQNGISDRFRRNPAAGLFLERQAIAMPAYGEKIDAAELDALWAFVQWVRAHSRHRQAKEFVR